MEIGKIAFYILLAIIYYGFKFLVKKNNKQFQGKPKNTQPGRTPGQYKPPVVFPVDPNLKPVSKGLPDWEREEARPEEVYYKEESLEKEGYESGSKRIEIENINPYASFNTISLSETTGEKTDSRFEQFKPVLKQSHPVLKNFSNRKGIKDAIILSEILNKKY